MGQFQNKWTDVQREAVISAVLEEGMTVREAVTAGASGQLGLAPFTMPKGTGYHVVAQAKRERNPEEMFTAEVDKYRRRAAKLVDRGLQQLEEQDSPAPNQIREVVRAVKELRGMASPSRPEPKRKTNGTAPEPPTDVPDLLTRLAEDERQQEPEDAMHCDALHGPEENGSPARNALQAAPIDTATRSSQPAGTR